MPYKTEKWPPKRHFSRRHPEALVAAGVAAEWSDESKGRTALCQHTAKKSAVAAFSAQSAMTTTVENHCAFHFWSF
ncbi:MAG: hypothetical protein DWI23_00880 [Planctomycetota bacterium]|nr:MAG: hypothetical protein DWI23_00880 [Planctomycetota bacterium]